MFEEVQDEKRLCKPQTVRSRSGGQKVVWLWVVRSQLHDADAARAAREVRALATERNDVRDLPQEFQFQNLSQVPPESHTPKAKRVHVRDLQSVVQVGLPTDGPRELGARSLRGESEIRLRIVRQVVSQQGRTCCSHEKRALEVQTVHLQSVSEIVLLQTGSDRSHDYYSHRRENFHL